MDQNKITKMLKETDTFYRSRNYIIAKMIYEQLIDHRQDIKESDMVMILNNMGSLYYYLHMYDEALEYYHQSYALGKKVLGEKYNTTLSSLENLATIYSELENYPEALKLQKRCYEISKEKYIERSDRTLRYLEDYARINEYMDNYQDAVKLYKKCYELRKETLGDKDPIAVTCLSNLAEIYRKVGNYQEALILDQQCYELNKEIYGENHLTTANNLNSVSADYQFLGKYQKAFELSKKSYELRKNILGERHPLILNSLNNLAHSYRKLGYYKEALELAKKCYELSKEIFGKKHIYTMISLSSLASSYRAIGNYQETLRLDEQCYKLRKEVLGERHPHTLISLGSLGDNYALMGNYQEALKLHKKCYELRKETFGKSHPVTLISLVCLGQDCTLIGDYQKAIPLYEECYKERKEELGENHPDTLMSLGCLGQVYYFTENYSKAIRLNKKCYDLFKDSLGETYPNTLISLVNLAFSYYSNNDYGEYYESVKKYFNHMNDQIDDMLHMIQNSNYRNMLERFVEAIALYKRFYFKSLNTLEDYHYIAAYKNIIQDIEMIEYNLKKLPEYQEKINYLNAIDQKIMNHRDVDKIIELQKEREEVSEELNKITSKYHSMLNLDIDATKIQSQLKDNDLLLDIYELKENKFGLVLIGNDSFKTYVFKDIEELQDMIEGSQKHLYICPDGELYNVSFERYIEGYDMTYLSSPKPLFYHYSDENNGEVVSFVYPDYSDVMEDPENERGNNIGVLFGSYLEGQSINRIYHEKNHLFKEKEANHHNFMEVNNPKVFHISTHGMYEKDNPGDLMERGKLCLAGYNIENKPEDYGSGYVTAGEIQSMNLKGTDLVVLSACNTGIGTTIKGEGLYGIRRAFELAGAKTMILTVEEIDDYNTAIFMKVFYTFYQQSNKIYESFKQTREYLSDVNHALQELEELKERFADEMKTKIGRISYIRHIEHLNQRIEEVNKRNYMVRLKKEGYVLEDWKGYIIQRRIED